MPEWASKIYDNLTKVATFESFNLVGTREMSRLTSGFLLREIVNRFNEKIDGSLQPNRNLWLYSGHDRTITRFMKLLDLLDVCTIFTISHSVGSKLNSIDSLE